MANKKWTDAQVEAEIARLTGSEFVKLAAKENSIKYKRRQYMTTLLYKEARGKELAAMGITLENMEDRLFGEHEDD